MEKIYVRDYGICPGEKDRRNTLRLRNLLAQCREKEGVELLFEKGEYHFYPDYASERTLCISNHDEDTLKRIGFDLTGLSHLKIKGDASDFIFHTEQVDFYLHESEDITLEGFSIDYERPVYSEGTVVSVDGSRMTIRIDKERFPYEIAHERIFFLGEGFREEIPFWMEVDPARQEPASGPWEVAFDTRKGADYGKWREIEEGLVEVTLDNEERNFAGYTPGYVIVLRHHPRNYPAIYATDSKNVTIRDVTIYHCAGMGVTAQFVENITLERLKVTGKPDSGHWFSLAADATHFVYCRGQIVIKDCLFERQLDDAVNIHGIYSRIKEVISDRELLVELVHHQQKGVPVGSAGDKISFVKYETLHALGEGEIEQIVQLNKDYTYVRFREPIPEVKPLDSLENISYVPDVLIEGCTVQNNRARGFLLTSAGKVVVRRNWFHTSGTAILVSGDAADWFESGATKNILIEDNTFSFCDYVKNWGQGVIQVDTPVREVDPVEKLHEYLEVRGNEFRSQDGEILNMKNVQKVVFTGNILYSEKNGGECFEMEDVAEFVEEDNIWK